MWELYNTFVVALLLAEHMLLRWHRPSCSDVFDASRAVSLDSFSLSSFVLLCVAFPLRSLSPSIFSNVSDKKCILWRKINGLCLNVYMRIKNILITKKRAEFGFGLFSDWTMKWCYFALECQTWRISVWCSFKFGTEEKTDLQFPHFIRLPKLIIRTYSVSVPLFWLNELCVDVKPLKHLPFTVWFITTHPTSKPKTLGNSLSHVFIWRTRETTLCTLSSSTLDFFILFFLSPHSLRHHHLLQHLPVHGLCSQTERLTVFHRVKLKLFFTSAHMSLGSDCVLQWCKDALKCI